MRAWIAVDKNEPATFPGSGHLSLAPKQSHLECPVPAALPCCCLPLQPSRVTQGYSWATLGKLSSFVISSKNWNPERLCGLPRITQLGNVRPSTKGPVCCNALPEYLQNLWKLFICFQKHASRGKNLNILYFSQTGVWKYQENFQDVILHQILIYPTQQYA